jgi:hypothetical protein
LIPSLLLPASIWGFNVNVHIAQVKIERNNALVGDDVGKENIPQAGFESCLPSMHKLCPFWPLAVRMKLDLLFKRKYDS